MLTKLRNRKIHLCSAFIITFAILAKMLVPIAHASNTSSNGQKSFLASLCLGNKVVFVDFNLSSENEPKPSVESANNECSLCNIVEQDTSNNGVTPITFSFQISANQFTAINDKLFNCHLLGFSTIRSPPVLS